MMRKMSNEMGEDVGPEFSEVVDRLESGQSPEDIEKAIPNLEGGTNNLGDDADF
jgi:exonuclease VII small subunit